MTPGSAPRTCARRWIHAIQRRRRGEQRRPGAPPTVSLDRAVSQVQSQPPPVVVNGRPNPEYQEYLETVVAPQMTGRRTNPGAVASASAAEPITAAMIAQIIGGAAPSQRTGEKPEDYDVLSSAGPGERYDPLCSAATGERVRRTDEDRRRLAEQNAPQGCRPRSTTCSAVRATGRGEAGCYAATVPEGAATRGGDRQAQHASRSTELTLAEPFAAAYIAQQQGATPMQQVYAQRMQNIQRAGIPLGARPQLLQY